VNTWTVPVNAPVITSAAKAYGAAAMGTGWTSLAVDGALPVVRHETPAGDSLRKQLWEHGRR
jgi:hypothetical protein